MAKGLCMQLTASGQPPQGQTEACDTLGVGQGKEESGKSVAQF